VVAVGGNQFMGNAGGNGQAHIAFMANATMIVDGEKYSSPRVSNTGQLVNLAGEPSTFAIGFRRTATDSFIGSLREVAYFRNRPSGEAVLENSVYVGMTLGVDHTTSADVVLLLA
jgi:hypothetical protein